MSDTQVTCDAEKQSENDEAFHHQEIFDKIEYLQANVFVLLADDDDDDRNHSFKPQNLITPKPNNLITS